MKNSHPPKTALLLSSHSVQRPLRPSLPSPHPTFLRERWSIFECSDDVPWFSDTGHLQRERSLRRSRGIAGISDGTSPDVSTPFVTSRIRIHGLSEVCSAVTGLLLRSQEGDLIHAMPNESSWRSSLRMEVTMRIIAEVAGGHPLVDGISRVSAGEVLRSSGSSRNRGE